MRSLLALAAFASLAHAAPAQRDPIAVVLVVDRASTHLSDVKASLGTVLDGLAKGDRVAVVAYGKSATVAVPMQDVAQKAKFFDGLDRLAAGPAGELATGMYAARDLLAREGTQQKRIVVLTDRGITSDGMVAAQHLRPQIGISAIGVGTTQRMSLDRFTPGHAFVVDDPLAVGALAAREAVLPVGRKRRAVVLVIDRSASMQGPRLELAKEIARVWIEMASPDDLTAVIAFDAKPVTILGPTRTTNRVQLSSEVGRITAGGSPTDLVAALDEARSIADGIAPVYDKQVVVISDGEIVFDGVADAATRLRAAHVTANVVGVQHADRSTLRLVAEGTDGRLYMVDDVNSIPRLVD